MNQKPALPDQKNFILAIVLSMAIIFVWQYFFAVPQAKKAEQVAQQQVEAVQQSQVPGTPAADGGVVARDVAIAATPRLPIETSELIGSINLTGAQFDDLKLKNLHEKADKTSPIITFLSPNGTANAYFAEQGVVAAAGQNVKLPDSKTAWSAESGTALGEDKPVILTWDNGEGLLFKREITITDDYVFTVKQTVENKSANPVSLIPYARVQRQDTPKIEGYFSFFEGLLGVQNGKLQEVKYADVADEGGKVEIETTGGWLGFTDKYWATALIPDQKLESKSTYQHFKMGARDAYQTDYLAKNPVTIAAGATGTFEDHIFAGAKVVGTIEKVGERFGIDKFDLMIDWGWFKFLTQPMFYLIEWAKGIMGNFGLAILLVTVLVKAAVFPLANKSYASMSKMKKLQPEMERIKAEYPDDRMKQQQAIMEMYKKEKVSPLSGCLPIFVQIPIFFALYKVILTTIELRHAPFYGWIHDLSAPDPTSLFNLFGLLPFTPPAILMLGVWPILMGITDALEPGPCRSDPGFHVQLDATHLHIHAGVNACRSRHLLDLVKLAVDSATELHHEAQWR
jgi:YidC/Oxa1 family membrane protein insertase